MKFKLKLNHKIKPKFKSYPITVSDVADYQESVLKVFRSKKRHNGAFVGVSLLEGSFMCENPESLYATLTLGEKLSLKRDNETDLMHASTLNVFRENGEFVGSLPFSASIFPCKLLDLGIDVWCHFEASALSADGITVAVSIYCEEY